MQLLRERCTKAEGEAAEAKRMASDEAGNVQLASTHSQETLDAMVRKYDDFKLDLERKEAAYELMVDEKTAALAEIDTLTAALENVRAELRDSVIVAEERSMLLSEVTATAESQTVMLESLQASKEKEAACALDAFNAKESELQRMKEDLEAQLQTETELTTSLKMDLSSVKAQVQKVGETSKATESKSTELEEELIQWKDKHHTLEMQLETATSDYALLEKNAKISETTAVRSAKSLEEDMASLRGELELSSLAVQKLESAVQLASSELLETRDRLKAAEVVEKEKDEECSLLLQQLAESEIKCEEHEKTLLRIRGERDESRLAKADFQAKVTRLEKETARLSSQLSSELSTGQSKHSELEDKYQETRRSLEEEKSRASDLGVQVRTLESGVSRLEQSERAMEKELAKNTERFTKERNDLQDQLQEAKLSLDSLGVKMTAEKEALELELKEAKVELKSSLASLAVSEKKIASLDQALGEAKTELSDAKDNLALLRNADQNLTTAQARFEKQSQVAEAEISSLRERLSLLEQAHGEEKTHTSENRHRAERAEQDLTLTQKDRDHLRDELKNVRETMQGLEKAMADRAGDVDRLQKDLEEEKQDHVRTQRGISDQQKLITGHSERNNKLSALIEEQKEEKARLQSRIKELEQAGSSAMSALTYQKDLQRLKEERDSAKSLVSQKTAELARMQQMLVSMEEKTRGGSLGGGVGDTSAELEEIQSKYNATIQINKKLEKQVTSLEAKYNFLKKKSEKK